MFEYMAAGIPIITTEFGARGIDEPDAYHIAEIEQFAEVIQGFMPDNNLNMVQSARRSVVTRFDWNIVSEIVFEALTKRG